MIIGAFRSLIIRTRTCAQRAFVLLNAPKQIALVLLDLLSLGFVFSFSFLSYLLVSQDTAMLLRIQVSFLYVALSLASCGSPSGSFAESCWGYTIDVSAGTINGAICWNAAHEPTPSYYPFKYCACADVSVANNDGRLACAKGPAPSPTPNPGGGCDGYLPGGNWATSCSGYFINASAGIIEHASCVNRDGSPVPNTDFAYCVCPHFNVTNDDGRLFCADSSACGPALGSWRQTCNNAVVDELRGIIRGAVCQANYPSPPVTNPDFSFCAECGRPIDIANDGGNLICK